MSRIIDIKTENIAELANLFEIFKDVLNDTVIQIKRPEKNKDNKKLEDSSNDDNESSNLKTDIKKTEDDEGGIRIFNIDDHQTLLIFVKLFSSEFLKFDCKYSNYDIGVELNPIYKAFKTMDKEGILSLYVDEDDKQQLNLDVSTSETKCITNYQIKLLDLNAKKWELPPSKFTLIVTMDCNEFHKICRNMQSVNCEFIEITCTEKKIIFSCVGDSSRISRCYENGGGAMGVKIKCLKNKKLIIVKNVYELKYLTMFNKCNNICSEIQIFLKDEYPMFIKYSIASMGQMIVGLSPITEKNLNRNSNYNPNNDIHYERTEIKMKD